MTVPTTSWAENSPAGSDNINLGDNRIREMKTQIREVIDIDHQFNSSGQDADNGKHTKVSLLEQANLGTGAEGKPILGAQTVSGKAELVFTDEDDNDIQITTAGSLGGSGVDALLNDITAASINVTDSDGLKVNGTDILEKVYPVGSIYINASDNTNPGTLLGFGTWTAFGAGRVMVGFDSGDTDFDSAEETGGSKTHTLTTDEMPAHNHTYKGNVGGSGSGAIVSDLFSSSSILETAADESISDAGGGSAHNNVQPYITCYLWKRTA